MLDGQTILAIIPARGGSKGIPLKNVREVGGKPLIAWTITEAKKSKLIDRLILSSDDDQIIKVAQEYGCEAPFVRPPELALDDTPGIEPVLHAIGSLSKQYDYVVLLQPTSPLRSVEDIDNCIGDCIVAGGSAGVTVTPSEQSPYWMYSIAENGCMIPIVKATSHYQRRQDLPTAYVLNGAVYVARTKWLQQTRDFLTAETRAIIMPAERSIDIDTEQDLERVNRILEQKR
jgi:CMP-N,N'-diacetyllegionaminic acid synthase